MTVRAVFFDVGETLVDEVRYWRVVADEAGARAACRLGGARRDDRTGRGALGALAAPRASSVRRTPGIVVYSSRRPVPGRARRASSGCGPPACCRDRREPDRRARGVGTLAALPVDTVTGSASLGVRKPERAFFERLVDDAGSPRPRSRTWATGPTTMPGRLSLRGSSPSTSVAARGGGSRRPADGAIAIESLAELPGALASVRVRRASDLRIGVGVDAHAFGDGVALVLGGVTIDHPRGLVGHSDGDVVAHALIDALLGAAGLPTSVPCFPRTTSATAERTPSRFLPTLTGGCAPRASRWSTQTAS